jgi:Arginine repressor, C-terminal domain
LTFNGLAVSQSPQRIKNGSSISRDIAAPGLTRRHGHYAAPQTALGRIPMVGVETAGDNLIVIKTDTGQASATALAIDRAGIDEIVCLSGPADNL